MSLNKIIWIVEHSPRADNEFEQNHTDTRTPHEGRSIGGVRDQSAPTGGRIHLSIDIIGHVRDQSGARSIGCAINRHLLDEVPISWMAG